MDWMGLIKIGTAKNTKNSLGKISLAQKKAKYQFKNITKTGTAKNSKNKCGKICVAQKKAKKSEKKCKILGQIFDKNLYCKKYQKNKWKKL